MKRFLLTIGTTILYALLFGNVQAVPGCQGVAKDSITLSSSGWTIKVNSEMEVLSLEHDSLGDFMKQIKLNFKSKQGLIPLKGWIAEKKGDNQLAIQTLQPKSDWIFELKQNNLIISSSNAEMVLTAKSPSSTERVVARLLDTRGVPVNWMGTHEIVFKWGGNATQNISYLPIKNPEVMTFALGQVSASNLHCLFDRGNDIAIVFSELTYMQRNLQDTDLLDITVPVPGNSIVKLIPDYYSKTLKLPFYSRFNDSIFNSAPMIWSSWTAYYHKVHESDIVSNVDWLSTNLRPYGFEYVQIDDGYDRGKKEGHYWIENWNSTLFPHGAEWLSKYIKSKGLRPGIWLVPNSYAGYYKQHADWYLHDKSGNPIIDYNTPALDFTNPAAQKWLKKLFSTLKGWGFEYLKFDGEFAIPKYAPTVDKTRLYDNSINDVVAYRNRLNLIRNIIGPKIFVEGCPIGTPLNGIGYFNSYFTGDDMYNSWKGSYAVFSSINANAFLNHMVVYVMPGEGIDVSPAISAEEAKQKATPESINVARSRENPFTGFGTSLAEARTLVSVVSLTGVAYPLTSIMPSLPEERVRLLKMTLPTMPILPVDLFSRGTDMTWDKFKYTTPENYIHNYPEVIDLKVNAKAGVYEVVGFTNWRSETVKKEISFKDKLGLTDGISYVVFDFWNQKFLGVFSNSMEIEIEPHDTRVLQVHALQKRPQLIGLSRHITGAYSIHNMEWNNSINSLSGSSETIQGETYSLFIYVPDEMSFSGIKATTKDKSDVKTTHELVGNLLKVSFQGEPEIVQWSVEFKGDIHK